MCEIVYTGMQRGFSIAGRPEGIEGHSHSGVALLGR